MKLYNWTILEYAENIFKNGILVDYKEAVRGTDIGVGFYTTNYAPLAINTAKTKSLYHKDDALRTAPVVVIMSFNISDAIGFNFKNFNRYDNEWKMFVCANRYEQVIQNNIDVDSNKDRKYDMVTGAVADSTMIDIRRSLKDNDYCITDSILGNIMPYKIGSHIPIQISFHNQDLVGCIRLLGYDIIK